MNEKIVESWDKVTERRLASGEAYMRCEDCGAKLYSFDGYEDASRKCPYMKEGKCEPTIDRYI